MSVSTNCLFYGCLPYLRPEIVYGVKFASPVPRPLWAELLSSLPGNPGTIHQAPPSAWELIEELDEDLARIDIFVWDEWAIVYQNLGYPLDRFDESPEHFRLGFESFVKKHPVLVEIVSLFGTTDDFEPDPWTEASLATRPPSAIPDLGDMPWSSPHHL